MKIRKVIASDFGCLSGEYELFDDRANVIVESNERGKSTLVAAILAGLYGFPDSRGPERKELPEKETYQPWKGASYQVSLEVEEDNGRRLLVWRDFVTGNVKVTDLSTNVEVTREFRDSKKSVAVGKRLLGMSRDAFLKTCLVRQLHIENLGETKEIQSKLEALFDSAGGKATAAKAVSVLEDAIRHYRGTQFKDTGLVENEIKRLQEAIRERESQIQELLAQRKSEEPALKRLSELRKRFAELETAREELEYLTRRAGIAETEAALEEDRKNRDEMRELIERKESLKFYADFTERQASDFTRMVGQLETLRAQRKQRKESLDKLSAERAKTQARLKDFKGFDGVGEEFKTRLHDLSTELKRTEEEVQAKRKELLEFEEAFRKDGYDLTEVAELMAQFAVLGIGDKDTLRDSEAGLPRIEADLAKLEVAERGFRDERRALRRPVLALGVFALLCWVTAAVLALVRVSWATSISLPSALTGVGLALLALVIRRIGSRKARILDGEEKRAREQREALLSSRDELLGKLGAMAAKIGCESVAKLSELFKLWGRLDDRAAKYGSLREEVKRTEGELNSVRETSSAELRKLGLDVSPAEINGDSLETAERKVKDYLELVSSLNKLAEEQKKIEEAIAEDDRQGGELRKALRRILSAAKLPEDLPPEQALPKIEEARKNAEEFHRLAKEIPTREQKLISDEKANRMKEQVEVLRAQVEQMLKEKPQLGEVQPTKTRSAYEEEARDVMEKRSKNGEERGRILREVDSIERAYHEHYPRLMDEVASLKETLRKTEQFQKSISLAIQTLQTISAESHSRWAAALNPRANEILRHLNPRCRELMFGRDLSFTVVPAEGEEPKDQRHIEAQQSVGARHQIYLAVRLALADYLSSEVRMPVILDDPFATSDDERFLSGMRYLCREFRGNHQLIILTCHRLRHVDFIREQTPELLDEIRYVELSRKEG
jgi:DNA repair exonuclease SbcCD ATPase subunit